jgi:hypothetical protein
VHIQIHTLYAHTHTPAHAHARAHTHTHTHVHTHSLSHIHVHTHTPRFNHTTGELTLELLSCWLSPNPSTLALAAPNNQHHAKNPPIPPVPSQLLTPAVAPPPAPAPAAAAAAAPTTEQTRRTIKRTPTLPPRALAATTFPPLVRIRPGTRPLVTGCLHPYPLSSTQVALKGRYPPPLIQPPLPRALQPAACVQAARPRWLLWHSS